MPRRPVAAPPRPSPAPGWLTDPAEWALIGAYLRQRVSWGLAVGLALWAVLAGVPWAAVVALPLVLLARIDAATCTLPNALVLPLGALGLVLAPVLPLGLGWAFLGAVLGFVLPMVLAEGFAKLTGKSGLGYGDVKLFAALGAWVGPLGLLLTALVASWAALAYVVVQRSRGTLGRGQKLPFGPFLVAGGWLALLYTPWFAGLLGVK